MAAPPQVFLPRGSHILHACGSIVKLAIPEVTKRSFALHAHVTLAGIDVLDLFAAGAATPPVFLMQSNPADTLAGAPRTRVSASLVDLAVVLADETGPGFATAHASTKQKLTCHLGDLRLVARPATLVKLQTFARAFTAPPAPAPVPAVAVVPVTCAGAADVDLNPADAAAEDIMHQAQRGGLNTLLRVEFASLELLLCLDPPASGAVVITAAGRSGARLAGLSLGGFAAHVAVAPTLTTVGLELATLSVDNLLSSADRYAAVVATVDQPVIDLRLTLDATPPAFQPSGHLDKDVVLRVNAVRAVYFNAFVDDLLAFLGSLAPPAPAPAADAPAAAATVAAAIAAPPLPASPPPPAPSRLRYHVAMHAPDIVVPLHASARRHLVLAMGRLTVDNYAALEETTLALGGFTL